MIEIVFVLLVCCFTQNNLFSQWEIVNEGQIDTIKNITLRDVYFINRGKGFINGGDFYNRCHKLMGNAFMTNDGGKTWSIVLYSDAYCPISCIFKNKSNGFLSSISCNKEPILYQTLDGGNSWFLISYRDHNYELSGSSSTEIFFVNEHIGYIVVETETYKTLDGGKSWKIILHCDHCSYKSIFSIDVNNVWIVGLMYLIIDGEGVTDGLIIKLSESGTWKKIASGTTLPLNKVFFVDINTGWIAGGYNSEDDFQPILLKTENGGESWFKIENVNYLIHDFYFENNQHGWAVGEDKNSRGIIIETKDGGSNWVVQVDSLSAPLRAIHFKDGYGWAVGGNGLILKTIDSTYTSIIEHNYTDNSSNILFQNYPNPFRSKTVISYQLSVSGEVEFSVYDLPGRKVATLVKEKQPAGRYEVGWDTEGIKPGIYFCELKAGQSRKVMKMIIIK